VLHFENECFTLPKIIDMKDNLNNTNEQQHDAKLLVSSRLSEVQRAKNIIERNNIMIEIYKNIDSVSDKVAEMRMENIQMQLFLNGC
jgi:hypothetical protein